MKMKKRIIRNKDIRAAADQKGVFYYEIADTLGVCLATFSRWMQHELPLEKKEEILMAIDKAAEEKEKYKSTN